FDDEGLTGPRIFERRLDERGAIARSNHERLRRIDLPLVSNEPVLGEYGQLVAESDDVTVRDSDAASAHASDVRATSALEVLQVNAVGADFDSRMLLGDSGADDAHVC